MQGYGLVTPFPSNGLGLRGATLTTEGHYGSS